MPGYTLLDPYDTKDLYENSSVPGAFRPLTEALNATQLAITLITIPPHSDFEQGTGHYHDELEEIYLITKGVLTMRFDEEIIKIAAGNIVRVSPSTARSHRNEGEETVEMWAISQKSAIQDAHKIDNFWDASPLANQSR